MVNGGVQRLALKHTDGSGPPLLVAPAIIPHAMWVPLIPMPSQTFHFRSTVEPQPEDEEVGAECGVEIRFPKGLVLPPCWLQCILWPPSRYAALGLFLHVLRKTRLHTRGNTRVVVVPLLLGDQYFSPSLLHSLRQIGLRKRFHKRNIIVQLACIVKVIK